MRKQQHCLPGIVQLNEWLVSGWFDFKDEPEPQTIQSIHSVFNFLSPLWPVQSTGLLSWGKGKRLPYGYFPTALTVRIHYCQRWHWKRHWTSSSGPSSCGGFVWQSGAAFTNRLWLWLKCVSCFLWSVWSTWCGWQALATLTVCLVISYCSAKISLKHTILFLPWNVNHHIRTSRYPANNCNAVNFGGVWFGTLWLPSLHSRSCHNCTISLRGLWQEAWNTS